MLLIQLITYQNRLRELVVNVVTKSGGINDSESNADTILLEFCTPLFNLPVQASCATLLTNIDRLNPYTFFNMCCLWIVCNLVRQHLRFAKCVYEGGSASARGACKRAGKCLGTTGGDENEKKLLTNYHDGKLDTFLDLVASTSACE